MEENNTNVVVEKKVEGRVRVHFGSMYGRCGRGWKLIAEK